MNPIDNIMALHNEAVERELDYRDALRCDVLVRESGIKSSEAEDNLRAAIEQALGQGEPVMLVPQQELDELRRCNGMTVWAENPQIYPPHCEGEMPAGYVALYTAPQPQQWVGLSEQEAAECWSSSTVRTWQAIEQRLKEKNT